MTSEHQSRRLELVERSEAARAIDRSPYIGFMIREQGDGERGTDGTPSSRNGGARRRVRPDDLMGDRLSDERVAELRARIASGVYDTAAVAEEVARRMLEVGDI